LHNRGAGGDDLDRGWLADWGAFSVHALSIRGTGQRSLHNYRWGVRSVARFLEGRGRAGWADASGADMRAYVDDSIARRGLARTTVAGRRSGAVRFLRHIGRQDLADAFVVASPRYYRRYSRQATVLTGAQSGELVKVPGGTASATRDRAVLAILHATGMRASELCGLSIMQGLEMVDRGKVTIRGKGNKEREVLVGPRTRDAVRLYALLANGARHALARSTPARRRNQELRANAAALFLGDHGARLTLDGLRRIVAKAGARIDVPHLTPLDLRHTFATLMYEGFTARAGLESDTAFMYLQRLMGHDKPETTQVYVHIAHVDLDAATRRLERGAPNR
jgi:integrase/recombinase XerD